MKNEKFLWCEKCREFPDKIIEKYLEPVEEIRVWDNGDYGLDESNIDDVEFEQLCFKCRSKLIDKSEEFKKVENES